MYTHIYITKEYLEIEYFTIKFAHLATTIFTNY